MIDDDQDSREVASVVLETSGFSVLTFASGVAALVALETIAPSLLISDLNMPGLDGCSFLRELRASTLPARHTLAIALTARDDAQRDCMAAGFQAYLVKPCPPDRLVSTVLRVLRARPPHPVADYPDLSAIARGARLPRRER